ncbi:MAG: CoA transferase [Actinomycetota bacterium]|nr:CoA transferase [Actinomycetota bacterium]
MTATGDASIPGGAGATGPELPLTGLRVLDLGSYISGPCAAVLLAEMGADVVKVEPPQGDPFRSWESGGLNATFVAFNRGKRSVTLDLKDDADRCALLELARTADVVIENFRPGVMERLGIDWDVLSASNPGLVHCSISGFGSSGPYATMPAYDGVALGYSGLAGLLLDPEDPRLRGPALADAITGHSAAFAVLAALHSRHRTGRGEHLEVSMLGALVHFLHSAVAKNVVEGRDETPYLRPHSSQAYVWSARDGRQVLVHMSSPPKFWEGLCAAVGRPDLAADPRFAQRRDRQASYEVLRTELAPVFAGRDRDEWLEVLQAHGVPCAPVNAVSEALRDPQLQHLGIIDVLDEPGIGPMPQIRPPALFGGAALPAVGRAPYLGEHTDELLGVRHG